MSGMRSRRWPARTAIAGTCLIALGAFWLSFTALADLAARSGIAERQAWAWPLIVDGIIVVATVSVVALGGQRSAWYPWMLLAGGALISVTANAVHAIVSADTDVPGLLAITHLTVILTRTPDEPAEAPQVAVHQVLASDDVPSPTPQIVPGGHMPELGRASSENETLSQNVASETTTDAPPSKKPVGGDSPADEAHADRRERARELREAGWSNKRIARHLGVHASTVGRWFALAHPTDGIESDTAGDEP
ncbi:DUF2637 domain-containing protein [Bifidobacterium mongoliense]|uniref:DUF2637 domain-containing protein n=1 Tax=Bifidobacterium mongoliense TaxID=518643 RepID=UPI0030EDC484